MDPLERRPWQDLPDELLADIADRLRCLADRVHMNRVCPSWGVAEAVNPRPRQLPWLLLPYRSVRRLPPNTARTAAFYCLLGRDTHHLRVGDDTRGARFFGSYGGGWLFLAHNQIRRHALVNINTDRRIRLPDSISWVVARRPTTLPMVILAATLSTSPPVPTEQWAAATLSSPPVPIGQCVAAAIVNIPRASNLLSPRQIAFWRIGHDQVAFGWTWGDEPCYLEDVIYHKGAFHFLTDLGNVLVCIPEFQEEAGSLVVYSRVLYFQTLPYWLEQYNHLHFAARYLVESRGELLMVVRAADTPGLASSEFRVFEMEQKQLPNGRIDYNWNWTERLYGRMLFVARGCSRSYEAADFPGFAEDVYFLDDRSSFDVSMMFRIHRYRQYACSDNGNWSWKPPPSRFFHGPAPSNYSSPIWLLP